MKEAVKHQTKDLIDDHLLAVALVNTEDDARAALRAAYRWGYERGLRDGFTRSFDVRHRAAGPPLCELRRRRGEDDHGRPLPRDNDYLGGPVEFETGKPLSTGKDTAA